MEDTDNEPIKDIGIFENIKYVGFWKRVNATIIDLIIFIPILILYMILNKYYTRIHIWWPYFLNMIFSYVYYLFFIVKYGGTPGKLITKIKIVDRNGCYILFYNALLRLLPQYLYSTFVLLETYVIKSGEYHSTIHIIRMTFSYLFFIDVLFIPFNKRKRAIHDYIAGSFVVKKVSISKINDNA